MCTLRCRRDEPCETGIHTNDRRGNGILHKAMVDARRDAGRIDRLIDKCVECAIDIDGKNRRGFTPSPSATTTILNRNDTHPATARPIRTATNSKTCVHDLLELYDPNPRPKMLPPPPPAKQPATFRTLTAKLSAVNAFARLPVRKKRNSSAAGRSSQRE